MERGRFAPGDPVVYRKFKHSQSPGPRARRVDPAPHGEEYTYSVDKFWIVVEMRSENRVLLATRRGKQHVVDCSDPNLRHARWWERVIFGDRFPKTSVLDASPNADEVHITG